jgi:hypothetical protein
MKKGGFTMKTAAWLSVLMLLGSVAAVGQMKGGGKAEEELLKLERERLAAVEKGDTSVLERDTADDYTLVNRNGQIRSKQETISDIKSGALKVESLKLDDAKVRLYGNTAVMVGHTTQTGTYNGKDISGSTAFTRVWVKEGGKWKSVALQQTQVASQ